MKITPEQYVQYLLLQDGHINQTVWTIIQRIQIPCYLGTNNEGMHSAHMISTIGPYFEGYFASYALGFAKPEKEFFQHIEKTLGLQPEELLFVDDMLDYINGALECGWHVFHYQNDPNSLVHFLKDALILQ